MEVGLAAPIRQGVPHRSGVFPTLGAVDGERLVDDVDQLEGHVVVQAVEGRDVTREDATNRLEVAGVAKEATLRETLPKHDARAPDVRASVQVFTPRLLRRHVGELALDVAGSRLRDLGRGLGDAEVEELGRALVGHEDVARRDVPMDDLQRRPIEVRHGVRVVQRVQDTGDDGDDQLEGEGLLRPHRLADDLVERLPLQILHRDVGNSIAGDVDLLRLHHVGVVETRGEASLVQEHVPELVLLEELGMHALDDDQLAEAPRAPRDAEEYTSAIPPWPTLATSSYRPH